MFPRNIKQLKAFNNPDNDYRGKWRASDLSARTYSENCDYTITIPSGQTVTPPPSRSWIFNEKKYKELVEDNRIWFGVNGDARPMQKKFLSDVKEGITPQTWWDRGFAGDNKTARYEIKSIFPENIFDTPKPSSLIKRILQIANSKDDSIILDFFAGSGTTGQAVTELNQADGGNRKYILVQLPETTDEKSEAYKAGYKKISDITIERNKRVIEKIINEKKKEQPDLFSGDKKEDSLKGLGFKVFKLVKSNFPRVEFAPDPEKTEAENIELLKKYINDKEAQLVSAFNRDELITEILIKNGFKLNYTLIKQEEFKKNEILLATDGEKETLICLDVIIADETVEYFKTNTVQKLIVLERALDTTKKWNLKHYMGDKFKAF